MFRRTATRAFAGGSSAFTGGAASASSYSKTSLFAFTSAAAVVSGTKYYWDNFSEIPSVTNCASAPATVQYNPDPKNCGRRVEGLPEFTYDEIAKHATCPTTTGGKKGSPSVWVHYKAAVYDITEFILKHPGGEKRIMLAAGGGVEKFWNIYTQHQDDAVRAILEPYRIGNVKDYKEAPVKSSDELWANEPKRSPGLDVRNQKPFNAETPEAILDQFITPNDLFFVRNHMPVPDVKVEGDRATNIAPFCLQVEGDGLLSRCFSIDELKGMFPQRTITTTIQCGGNRRSEMEHQQMKEAEAKGLEKPKAVKGLSWSCGGIGTASWTGVLLSDIMAACSPPVHRNSDPNWDNYHVHFFGADSDAVGPFSVSVPYTTASNRENEVLVAWHMNGEDIPRDHGYPLRAVVPGHVGVRNCKWLNKVAVRPEEAQSVWQQSDYKYFPPWATKPDPSLPSVHHMPVQSSVTSASYDSSNDEVTVKGYAYCGGGTAIQRVELSLDGGKSFQTAAALRTDQPERLPKAHAGSERNSSKQWAWTPFEATVDVEKTPESFKVKQSEGEEKQHTFVVCSKAITVDNQSQPEKGAYNFRGLLFNGYSCKEADII